ncbi:MAG: hypothetical protein KIG68_09610 [Oxalobacter sp.]|nr:hypothetical protein [Oxalobacter sp.]
MDKDSKKTPVVITVEAGPGWVDVFGGVAWLVGGVVMAVYWVLQLVHLIQEW